MAITKSSDVLVYHTQVPCICVLFKCYLVIILVVYSCKSSVCCCDTSCLLKMLFNSNQPPCTMLNLLNCEAEYSYEYTAILYNWHNTALALRVTFLRLRSLNTSCCRVIFLCSKGHFMLNTMMSLVWSYCDVSVS